MLLDYSGITFFTKYSETDSTYSYEGIVINHEGIKYTSATKYKDSNDEVHQDIESYRSIFDVFEF